MTHETLAGVTWEGLLQLLLEKFEIPSMDEVDRLKQRLDRLENIIFRENMIKETTGLIAADRETAVQKTAASEAEGQDLLEKKSLKGDVPEQDKPVVPKKASKRKSAPKKKKRSFDSDVVLKAITDDPDGTDFKTIMTVTKYEDKKLRNIIYRLDKTGKIKKVNRGVYKKI